MTDHNFESEAGERKPSSRHAYKVKIAELKNENEQLRQEKSELNDRFLRLYSEFDNYKKRTQKEKLDLLSTAAERVIVDLLPVVDNFERAIKANEHTTDQGAIKDGFILIYNQLLQLLKKNNVEEIVSMHQDFDTDFHEAITRIPATGDEQGKVLDVTEKGYKMQDKVIRFAKVVVGQ
ncbi:MAG: nucleotide exchange factor GrpE [Bacteroidales bacterium]|jgi:molecular chaperone GrpE|nr:nucleotide exchange factor GrpE [Bacteroidales bacterium]